MIQWKSKQSKPPSIDETYWSRWNIHICLYKGSEQRFIFKLDTRYILILTSVVCMISPIALDVNRAICLFFLLAYLWSRSLTCPNQFCHEINNYQHQIFTQLERLSKINMFNWTIRKWKLTKFCWQTKIHKYWSIAYSVLSYPRYSRNLFFLASFVMAYSAAWDI